MARKELTLDAMKIADSIRNQSVRVKDCHVAEAIGVDAATICRFKAEHLDKFCAPLLGHRLSRGRKHPALQNQNLSLSIMRG